VIHGLDDLVVSEDDIVQHTDVMQTLVEMVNGRTDQMQGVDLRHSNRTYAISQRQSYVGSPYEQNPEFDLSRFHERMLTTFRSDRFRYMWSDDRNELFELPDECTDVSEEYPEVAKRLKSELTDWLSQEGQPVSRGTEDNLTESMRRQLRDLGYVE
jgi:hypothetical protein